MHLFDIDVEGGQYFKESDVLTPGKDVTVFDTEFCRIGLGICYDIRFPELSRLMVLEGAEVIIFPAAFNMTTGPAHWELNFRGRALDNQVYTIGVAPARDMESSYHSYGNSIVASPWGNVLNRMDEKEGFVVQEIDLDYVKKVREQLPLLKHLRRDIYKLSKL
jgi:predicted amidohydrolase